MGSHLPFFMCLEEAAMAAQFKTTAPRIDGSIDCPVLVTERLVLRAPHADDISDLAELANNRNVAEKLARMPHPYGFTDALEFLAMAEGREAGCIYAVTLAETGRFIGTAGLEDWRGTGLEIGYWLGEPFWGRGYGTEAAGALVDLAFRATGVDVLHASCRTGNAASRRVLEKCGFVHAGEGVLHSRAAGEVSATYFELERDRWLTRLSTEMTA